MKPVDPIENLDQALLLFFNFLPVLDRIGQMQMSGAKDEILIVRQRHLGLLSIGISRELRPHPGQGTVAHPLEQLRHQRLSGQPHGGLSFRVNAGEVLGVLRTPDGNQCIHLAHFQFGDRRDVFQLSLLGLLEEHLFHFRREDFHVGMCAHVQRFFVACLDERECYDLALNFQQLTLLQIQ